MKADGVDAWLKLQKKNKHPLVLRKLSNRLTHPSSTIASHSEGEVWKGKACYIESNGSNEEEEKDRLDDDGMDGEGLTNADHITDEDNEVCSDAKMLPQSPHSSSKNHKTWRTFFTSLSVDVKCKKLMLLLHVVEVSEHILPQLLSEKHPGWQTTEGILPSLDFMGVDGQLPFNGLLWWYIHIILCGI